MTGPCFAGTTCVSPNVNGLGADLDLGFPPSPDEPVLVFPDESCTALAAGVCAFATRSQRNRKRELRYDKARRGGSPLKNLKVRSPDPLGAVAYSARRIARAGLPAPRATHYQRTMLSVRFPLPLPAEYRIHATIWTIWRGSKLKGQRLKWVSRVGVYVCARPPA